MSNRRQTWHYGLVARYWAEHNTDGPEIAYFQSQIERLLIPFSRAGLDVDGCDVSSDMLSLCRAKAEHEGLRPRLYQQALHELDLPRTYQTTSRMVMQKMPRSGHCGVRRQMRALLWCEGRCIDEEEHILYDNLSFRNELCQML